LSTDDSEYAVVQLCIIGIGRGGYFTAAALLSAITPGALLDANKIKSCRNSRDL
jgi:hypothetical protein